MEETKSTSVEMIPEELAETATVTPAAEPTEAIAQEPLVIEEAPAAEPLVEKPVLKTVEKPTPAADFDWDAYEKGDVLSAQSKEEMTKVYDTTLTAVKDKEVVEGTVISINKREVVVNINYKSDGVVPMSEFRYNPDLQVGDRVEVYIESQEDPKGQLLLSHKQARASRSWERVNTALETQEIVKGYVKCRTKGGMIVDIFGLEAFLPGSQIDVKPIRDYDIFVGKTMEFKVVKINSDFKNVVVSHKALIEEELEAQRQEIIKGLQKGQVLEGVVKNITTYGVFVDLGGVDGLIHITDLSWGRVTKPEEVVQLEEKLNVVILDYDEEKRRIALGLKQLTPHPWEALDPDLKAGDKIKGKVVVMADYGAFVEVAPGVEGLIHVSEMSWSQHLRSAQDFLKVGDEVETMILSLDRDERKMSLGLKQLKDDPWNTIEEKYPLGSRHTAKVRNFTNFGVFVEIEEGVDGLIHISDLSWTKKIKHPSEFTKIGENLDVVVLDIDKDNRRLSLGHKQMEENPWDAFEGTFEIDSVHEGHVVEFIDKGAIVALPCGIEAFTNLKNLVKADGTQAQVDEKLPFKVLEFNKDARRIFVSHTRTYEEAAAAESEEKPKHAAKRSSKKEKEEPAEDISAQPALEKTTLGDLQQLVDLKDQMAQTAEKVEKAVKKTAKKTAKKAEETVEKVEEELKETIEKVEETAEKTVKKARKTAAKAAKTVEEAAEEVAETAENVAEKLEEKTEE